MTFKLFIDACHWTAQNTFFWIIMTLVFMDLTTGLMKAFYTKTPNSTTALQGVLKHSAIVMVICAVSILSHIMKLDFISNGLIIFFATSYGISILENLGQMNIIVPKWLKEILVKVQQYYDNDPKGGTKK